MGVIAGGDSGVLECAYPNVGPAGIRYFRHAEIQQELKSASCADYRFAIRVCLIAGAALQASIKYALPQRRRHRLHRLGTSVGKLPAGQLKLVEEALQLRKDNT